MREIRQSGSVGGETPRRLPYLNHSSGEQVHAKLRSNQPTLAVGTNYLGHCARPLVRLSLYPLQPENSLLQNLFVSFVTYCRASRHAFVCYFSTKVPSRLKRVDCPRCN